MPIELESTAAAPEKTIVPRARAAAIGAGKIAVAVQLIPSLRALPIVTVCVAVPGADTTAAWVAVDVARPVAAALRDAAADNALIAVEAVCAVPGIAIESAWLPPPPRLAPAVVASVIGALTVLAPLIAADTAPGSATDPAWTLLPPRLAPAVAVSVVGALAAPVPLAATDAAPDTVADPVCTPPLLRLAPAVAASVAGAVTMLVPLDVADAVPGAVMAPVATARPVVAAAELPANPAVSAKNPPVPTCSDVVAVMGAVTLLMATAFVVTEPDTGRLAALRAVSTLDAAVAGDPLRDDVLFQMAVFVEAMVPVVDRAATPPPVAMPAGTSVPVPAMLAD